MNEGINNFTLQWMLKWGNAGMFNEWIKELILEWMTKGWSEWLL